MAWYSSPFIAGPLEAFIMVLMIIAFVIYALKESGKLKSFLIVLLFFVVVPVALIFLGINPAISVLIGAFLYFWCKAIINLLSKSAP